MKVIMSEVLIVNSSNADIGNIARMMTKTVKLLKNFFIEQQNYFLSLVLIGE